MQKDSRDFFGEIIINRIMMHTMCREILCLIILNYSINEMRRLRLTDEFKSMISKRQSHLAEFLFCKIL